jgi:hypothetical protein
MVSMVSVSTTAPPRHDSGHRTAAERDHQRVELVCAFEQLEAHGARALACGEVQAVLDQVGAFVLGDPPGQQPGILDVVAFEPDGRTKRPDALDLERVGRLRRHDRHRDPAPRAAVGERLTEVAGACADRGRRIRAL